MTAKEIYNALITAGMTPEGACGLMGNFEAESSNLRAANAEGWPDEQDERYTAEVDAGKRNFLDSIGYGLAQWTWWTRKKALLAFAKSRGVSVGNANMQIDFCIQELKTRYTAVWDVLCSTNDLYRATALVCTEYEKPAVNNIDTRYKYAKRFYNEFGNCSVDPDSSETEENMTKDEAITKLVECAKKQVGYLEKRTNAQLDDPKANAGSNNWNRYARDIDTKYPEFYNGRKNGFSWCDIFVDWCFIECFGYENALKMLYAPKKSAGAGCKYSADYYRRKGQFFNAPQVGDQVFFGDVNNEGHTGIVVAVEGDIITTVEGNTSGGYGVDANGDGVYLKRYNTSTQYIPGYGRPDWSVVTGGTIEQDSKPVVSYPLIRRGSKGAAVKKAQQLLISKGYDCGTAGADGEFGYDTYRAVLAFQRVAGLETDGIIGADTWAALLCDDKPTEPETKPEPDKGGDDMCNVSLPVLRYGAKGFPVLAAQVLLTKHDAAVKHTDGDFGPDTQAKVKLFQQKKHLTADGIVGAKTWAALIMG